MNELIILTVWILCVYANAFALSMPTKYSVINHVALENWGREEIFRLVLVAIVLAPLWLAVHIVLEFYYMAYINKFQIIRSPFHRYTKRGVNGQEKSEF